VTSVITRYHLKDVIVGKIYFLLVRIKIKHMELSIIRRETTGAPPNQYNESETITKFEVRPGLPSPSICTRIADQYRLSPVRQIMDGAPVRGLFFAFVPSQGPEIVSYISRLTSIFLPRVLRRDDSDPVVPWWFRAHADVPGHQQEVLCALLPQPRPHRRREQTVSSSSKLLSQGPCSSADQPANFDLVPLRYFKQSEISIHRAPEN
jgi:hypothetical protein